MPTELLTGLVSRMNSKLPFLSGEYGVFLKETVWRITAWVLSVYILLLESSHSCSGFLEQKSVQLMTTGGYFPFYSVRKHILWLELCRYRRRIKTEKKQRSWLLFGGKNLFNSLPRYLQYFA